MLCRSCCRTSLTGSRSKWRPGRPRTKISPCRLKSTLRVWWQLLQRLWPRATPPPPASASKRSARSPPAPGTRSSPDPGCLIPRSKQRHPRTARPAAFCLAMNSTRGMFTPTWEFQMSKAILKTWGRRRQRHNFIPQTTLRSRKVSLIFCFSHTFI